MWSSLLGSGWGGRWRAFLCKTSAWLLFRRIVDTLTMYQKFYSEDWKNPSVRRFISSPRLCFDICRYCRFHSVQHSYLALWYPASWYSCQGCIDFSITFLLLSFDLQTRLHLLWRKVVCLNRDHYIDFNSFRYLEVELPAAVWSRSFSYSRSLPPLYWFTIRLTLECRFRVVRPCCSGRRAIL